MKKIGRILLGAALALGIMVGNSSVEAHSMTISEATLVVGSGQEGAGEIKAGDKLGKVIALLGDNYELQDFGGEGIRMTKYIYASGSNFYGWGSQKETCPAEEVKLVGYTLKDNVAHTLSGIAVGSKYEQVEEKFGAGEKREPRYNDKKGITTYLYDLYNGVKELEFSVDENGIIQKIAFRQEL